MIRYLAILLMLTACTTPRTVLKNYQTGQVVVCGGTAYGSMTGGAIGYHIQKGNDSECVDDYVSEGFKKQKYTE